MLINSITYASPYYYSDRKPCYQDSRSHNQLKPIYQIKKMSKNIELYQFKKIKNELVLTHDSPLNNEYQFSGIISVKNEYFGYYQRVSCF